MSQSNKQKQTTKVIVKIGSDVIKQKRRRVKRQKQKAPEPQPQPQIRQSFGTLLPQNTSFNSNIQSSLENVLKQQADLNALFNKLQSSSQSSFTSNIKNPLENILKTESNLNKTVDKLRADQRPEDNEGQNAQLVSGLNLNNDRPIDYQELLEKQLVKEMGTQMDINLSDSYTQTEADEKKTKDQETQMEQKESVNQGTQSEPYEKKGKDQETQSKPIQEIIEEEEKFKRNRKEMLDLFGTTEEEQEKLREQEREERKKERERVIKSKSKEREFQPRDITPAPGENTRLTLEKFEKEMRLKEKPTGDLVYALRRQNFEKEIQKIKDRNGLLLWMYANKEKINFKDLFPQRGVPSSYS